MALPRRLTAPAPTWERDVDVVVLGSGAAGLSAALAVRPVRSVLVVTKDVLEAGSTQWAQGGLAGVLDPADSTENHVRDTLVAGAGLCDERVVRQLVEQAPTSIRYLMRLGAAFDPDHGPEPRPGFDLDIALTREGGHSHDRIVHSGGDRSGAEVQRTLDESAIGAGVDVMNHTFGLDLVFGRTVDGTRQVAGVRVARTDRHGSVTSVGTITARAVVIACGGYGQVFASTSNPPAVTGDGIAMALRAGLPVRDSEFVQFHPTVHVARARSARSAGARVRGRSWRGSDPVRRRRRPDHGGRPPAGGPRARATSCRRRSARAWPRRRAVSTTTSTSMRRTWASVSPLASRRSTRRARRSVSTRPPIAFRSPRPRTTAAEASEPTSTGRPRCRVCSRSGR